MTASQTAHLLTGAAAAHALTAQEQEDFAEHLRDCDTCALEVRELQAATTELGLAVAQDPPAELKARVLAQVATSRQLPARPSDLAPYPSAAPPPQPVPSPRPVSSFESATRRAGGAGGRWWRSPVAAAAAVLLVAVVGLGGLAAVQNRRIDQLAAAVQQRDVEQRSSAARIEALVRDPDRRTVAAPVQGGGTGTVVLADGQALFLGDGLAAPPTGRAYQLWVIRSADQVRSAGVLAVANGSVTQLVDDVRDTDTVGLSVEPASGSPAPTTKPVLLLPV